MDGFHFIAGDDDFLVNEKARALYDKYAESVEDDLSKEVLDGRAGNVDEVTQIINQFTSAVQTLSLFGDKKVVWLKDVSFFSDSQTGRAEGTQRQLEVLQNVLEKRDPSTVTIIISAIKVDKRRVFYKWISKNSETLILEASKNKEEAAKAHVLEYCRQHDLKLDPMALEILVAKVNGDVRVAVGEVEKLSLYLMNDGGHITENLVNEMVSPFGEGDFFEPVEAFFTLRVDYALGSLRKYFFNNQESRPLISSLQNRNRLLIQLRVLMNAGQITIGPRGVSKSQLESAAKLYMDLYDGNMEKSGSNVFSQNPWYLGRLCTVAKRCSLKKLVAFQEAFLDGFTEILERPNNQESVMREMFIRCLV